MAERQTDVRGADAEHLVHGEGWRSGAMRTCRAAAAPALAGAKRACGNGWLRREVDVSRSFWWPLVGDGERIRSEGRLRRGGHPVCAGRWDGQGRSTVDEQYNESKNQMKHCVTTVPSSQTKIFIDIYKYSIFTRNYMEPNYL